MPWHIPDLFHAAVQRVDQASGIISPVLGKFCGFAVWLGTAYTLCGKVTIASAGLVITLHVWLSDKVIHAAVLICWHCFGMA